MKQTSQLPALSWLIRLLHCIRIYSTKSNRVWHRRNVW